MRRSLRPAALAVLLLLSACASEASPDEAAESSSEPAPPAGLVLRVDQTGGFVMPSASVGRLPVVAVYADGRVITQGPVPAIYPGPALPNLQVAEIEQSQVQDVVDQALAAGVAETGDLGSPPVADAFSTRFTVVTAEETYVREVYALWEAPDREGGAPVEGVTEEQAQARDRLVELLDSLTGLGTTSTTPYEPAAVAAIAAPWIDPGDGMDYPPIAWPGPALPGTPTGGPPGMGCVSVAGAEVAPLLELAGTATQLTPWTTPDGARWSVTFRPLLPEESGCEDLTE